MTTLQHFRTRAWAARRPPIPEWIRPSKEELVEWRRSELREALRWRVLREAGEFPYETCQQARYQALLAAYSLRLHGVA